MSEFTAFEELPECLCDDCTARDWSLGFEACPMETSTGGLPVPLPVNEGDCPYYNGGSDD